MLTLYKCSKSKVFKQLKNGILDDIVASNGNLVDDIILSMIHEKIIDCFSDAFKDKRRFNSKIPFNVIMTLAIAAKMKVMTSLTDIPYAIKNHVVLSALKYNFKFDNRIFSEGTIRHFIGKYDTIELFNYYNKVIKSIYDKKDIYTDIHILDCTKIAVNKFNSNFEQASWGVNRRDEPMFGYKLASLRGLYGDTGIIEEVNFGTASIHDLDLCENLLINTPHFHEGDVLLMDRGFISRKMIKYLRDVRKIHVYIPVRKNMAEYRMALTIAEELDDWKPHPTRNDEMICHVPCTNMAWTQPGLPENVEENIDLNACVVWVSRTQDYYVFTTTDMSKSAEEIIMMYEMRPEIEEDFRQLKDFWKLEDFHSTKLNVISFHIICVLFGYLFYQLYLNTDDGQKYVGKSLPVILKTYKSEFTGYLTLYSGEYYCIVSLGELMELCINGDNDLRNLILNFLKK